MRHPGVLGTVNRECGENAKKTEDQIPPHINLDHHEISVLPGSKTKTFHQTD